MTAIKTAKLFSILIGFSEEAANLITAARRQGTIKHYQSAWYSGKQIDPFLCSIDNIINFLTCTFNENKEYINTIAGYMSAISAYHDPITVFQAKGIL